MARFTEAKGVGLFETYIWGMDRGVEERLQAIGSFSSPFRFRD